MHDGVNMAELINLNRHRKRVAKDEAAKRADLNRVRFGRSKLEQTLDEQRESRASALLNQHLLDGEETS